jgi:hypothetical protein
VGRCRTDVGRSAEALSKTEWLEMPVLCIAGARKRCGSRGGGAWGEETERLRVKFSRGDAEARSGWAARDRRGPDKDSRYDAAAQREFGPRIVKEVRPREKAAA